MFKFKTNLFAAIAMAISDPVFAEIPKDTTARYQVALYQNGQKIALTPDADHPFIVQGNLQADAFELIMPRFQCATNDKSDIDVVKAAVGIRTETDERARILKHILTSTDPKIRLNNPDATLFHGATGAPWYQTPQTHLVNLEQYDLLEPTIHAYFIDDRFAKANDETATILINSIIHFEDYSQQETELLRPGLTATLFIKVHDDQCIRTDKTVDILILTFR
ncbi:hypothetical protein [Parasulfitobacter algicola]|uniref:Uncharacterized protein n=1 Tax=Parasulfitobacter algicola TaxID=2614809 RepID=A0ABX2IQ53_9RHOB|nr:hypothetical protein [Sulfitobacter algicola]NSX54146.1 hypothetical protein [Sulfitobacter algicola]